MSDEPTEETTSRTTRQRIADALRESEATASELAARVDVPVPVVYDHVSHVAQSLSATDEELLVAPPTCRRCGFDGFDDRANQPSRCPECRSEDVAEPVFTIHGE
ncbi:transcriptional regulator [Halalkaliarchaeum sp. AArc-GB]|uniref:transcriptional regulator n=1 Tax=Halalkaliarchaeum sp. AArc-GB TaxID=3074078 RepID=UPI00285C93AE|nr:transcriptional regulator [Halalkaliarchaeum sp. AArc-GB]MDR5672110.1 transcriptional regulator [Halalkaliarchaeum sp. AArc-GB]